jgi:hypothetical protein
MLKPGRVFRAGTDSMIAALAMAIRRATKRWLAGRIPDEFT